LSPRAKQGREGKRARTCRYRHHTEEEEEEEEEEKEEEEEERKRKQRISECRGGGACFEEKERGGAAEEGRKRNKGEVEAHDCIFSYSSNGEIDPGDVEPLVCSMTLILEVLLGSLELPLETPFLLLSNRALMSESSLQSWEARIVDVDGSVDVDLLSPDGGVLAEIGTSGLFFIVVDGG